MKKLMMGTIFFCFLTACASLGQNSTPAQKVFAATQDYDIALSVAVAYKRLPSCHAQPKVVLCSEPSVIATIQKADTVAYEALSAAQKVIRSQNPNQSSLQTAVNWATGAVAAFSKITATLSVK